MRSNVSLSAEPDVGSAISFGSAPWQRVRRLLRYILGHGNLYAEWTLCPLYVSVWFRPAIPLRHFSLAWSSDLEGADSLQLWKIQRDRTDLHFRLGDPNCIAMGDPNFQLRLPGRLLFDDAPIPPALVGVENVVFDLFSFKREFLGLP